MKNIKHIGIDLDGVCRNFIKGFNDAFVSYWPEFKDCIVEEADHWDWFLDYPWEEIKSREQSNLSTKEFILEWAFSSPATAQILQHAPVLDGTYQALELLNAFAKENDIKLSIVTHQRTAWQKEATYKWLQINKIDVENVIIVDEAKEKWNHVDLMFDDSPEVILSCPVGKHYVKIETKYNRFTKVEHSAPSFLEAVKYFIQIYKK